MLLLRNWSGQGLEITDVLEGCTITYLTDDGEKTARYEFLRGGGEKSPR